MKRIAILNIISSYCTSIMCCIWNTDLYLNLFLITLSFIITGYYVYKLIRKFNELEHEYITTRGLYVCDINIDSFQLEDTIEL